MAVDVTEAQSGPVLRGPALELACHLADGSLSLRPLGGGLPWLPRCRASAVVGDPPVAISTACGFDARYSVSPIADKHGRGTQLSLTARREAGEPFLRLHAALYEDQPFAVLRLEVENAAGAPLPVHRLTVMATPAEGRGRLRMPSPPSRWSFYRQGWQSWTPALIVRSRDDETLAGPPVIAPEALAEGRAGCRGYVQADDLAVLKDLPSGASVLAGFISGHDMLSQVRGDMRRRSLEALCFADGLTLAPGETLSSERLLVDLSGPAEAALARYGDALGRQMGARRPPDTSGWCSWYYYFWGISEELVLRQLDFLARHRQDIPLEYIQIDDGYATGIGDWTACNERFPHGMAWLADRIREAGFKPALWLAPFMVGEKSALFREHPEWLVRGDDGRPALAMHNWDQECYGLDCSHPQALAWVEDLFRQVVAWGYEYVKIDFVFAAAVAGRRYDPQVTRAQAYRRGVEAVRRAVGERFILGCGALMAPSVGLVDGMRIGPDVAPWWRHRVSQEASEDVRHKQRGLLSLHATENSLRNILTRYWSHRRLWLNDPDCLLVRDQATTLTPDEVRTLATAVALSGGMLLASDDMAALPEARLDILRALLPPYGRSATPLDLFESDPPALFQLYVTRPFEAWSLLGAFNWDGRRRRLRVPLPPGPHHVFDFWTGRYFGVAAGHVDIGLLPPHGCRLLALRPDRGHPQLLSTSFHFTQGALEVEDSSWQDADRRLSISLRPVAKRKGELIVVAPAAYRLARLEVRGTPVTARARPDGILAVALELLAPVRLQMAFDS